MQNPGWGAFAAGLHYVTGSSDDPDTYARVGDLLDRFGHDLDSARELQALVTEVFPERSCFRIDHYLGKESVQNIIAFRFANGIFEPVWNHHFVDHVQVTVAESIGVEHRGNFYETAGAIRDIIQNHALQILALVAMEPPAAHLAEDVRNEKAKVLKAVHRLRPDEVDVS